MDTEFKPNRTKPRFPLFPFYAPVTILPWESNQYGILLTPFFYTSSFHSIVMLCYILPFVDLVSETSYFPSVPVPYPKQGFEPFTTNTRTKRFTELFSILGSPSFMCFGF